MFMMQNVFVCCTAGRLGGISEKKSVVMNPKFKSGTNPKNRARDGRDGEQVNFTTFCFTLGFCFTASIVVGTYTVLVTFKSS